QLAVAVSVSDGFLGDGSTVTRADKPSFHVERRKYRFRILNGGVGRFFKIALANASGQAQPIVQIANDGNLLPQPIMVNELDEEGIGERYDIMIDFATYQIGDRLHLVNLAEHDDGRGTKRDLSVSEALAGGSDDPCVGRFLEFVVVRNPANGDPSQVPSTLVPNPDLSAIPVARERTFLFGRGGKQTRISEAAFGGPWGISTEGGEKLNADYGRISSAPRYGTREIWHFINDGGGWDHPIHVHFEESQILARNGSAATVPAWERGRKDVFRLWRGGSVSVTCQFRD